MRTWVLDVCGAWGVGGEGCWGDRVRVVTRWELSNKRKNSSHFEQ